MRGKSYAAWLWAQALLDQGETVIFAKPSGWTKVRRYKRNGKVLDSIEPLPDPKNGTEIKMVLYDELEDWKPDEH